jgi:hypothetical protein
MTLRGLIHVGGTSEGFSVQVDLLDEAARTTLPAVADTLRAPIKVMTDHRPTARPMTVDVVSSMEREYGAFTQEIGNRQRAGADIVDATADALRDIVAVYRRVDGQG